MEKEQVTQNLWGEQGEGAVTGGSAAVCCTQKDSLLEDNQGRKTEDRRRTPYITKQHGSAERGKRHAATR